MKKFFVLFAVVASLAAIPVSNVLVKAHQPAHKEQVCHNGSVRTVGENAVEGHLVHGDCFIDKRDGNAGQTFFTGDACISSDCDTFPSVL